MSKRKCRHVGRSGCVVSMDTIKHICDVVPPEHRGEAATGRGCMQYQTCATCGSWLPLGPSRDDGEFAEAVAIEVRAAEIMSDLDSFGCNNMVPLDDCEGCGWAEHRSGGTPRSDRQFAGYLARCIATHDSQQSEES